MRNPWLCWGFAPFVSANVGYFGTVFFLEYLIRQGFMRSSMIEYGKSGDRPKAIEKTHERFMDFKAQLKNAAWNMLGPMAWINTLILPIIVSWVLKREVTKRYPTKLEFLAHFALLELVGDFFLYVGHRVQHEIPFLWEKCHSFHHSIDTPTPVSTVCIDPTDASLQGGLPILGACLVVNPHPITLSLYVMARLAENVVNHSGVENLFLNVLFLKVLPLRAPVSHHDSHHKFSNYGPHAKNYGENFIIWDYIFGTLKKTSTAPHKSRPNPKES